MLDWLRQHVHSLPQTTLRAAGGDRRWGEALLSWSRSFRDFSRMANDLGFFGWTAGTVDVPCSWTGIRCSPDSAGFEIHLAGHNLTGAILMLCLLKVPAPKLAGFRHDEQHQDQAGQVAVTRGMGHRLL